MIRFTKFAVALAVSAVAASSAAAQVTVGVPGNAANGTTYPFGMAAGFTKFQQIYDASLFSAPFGINSVSFYSKLNSGTLQQGTFNFYLNTTSTTIAGSNGGNPLANETVANRKFFGTLTVGNATTNAPPVLTLAGTTFNYNPASGNLVLDIDFTPVGSLFATGRASFDQYYDPRVGTSSDVQAFLGVTNGIRGTGLVTTFNASVVPEPSSVFLMMAGLAGVGFAARRRNASKGFANA